MASAAPLARRPPRQLPPGFGDLVQRTRPTSLAKESLLPVARPLTELLGTPGLRRGSTVVVHGDGAQGATSLLLALLAGPSMDGAWCAVVGAPELGLVAAGELGVALDRLVLVPEPGRRLAQIGAALVEGCDLVCLRCPSPLAAPEARRLAARARERKVVLLIATGSTASLGLSPAGGPVQRGAVRPGGAASSGWYEMPDVALAVRGGRFEGVARGSGRVRSHLVEVVARRRRAAPEEVVRRLWLPDGEGRLTLLDDGAEDWADESAASTVVHASAASGSQMASATG
jgi:hypothetical protein